jgi:GH15 family glucan-1,4-alpha-glucosidase
MVATYEHIQRRLGRGRGLFDRYEAGHDGLASPEGAFGICSFWAIDNLARHGDLAAAERSFAALLAFANDLGLYAEEIDPATGAALGNFPQAFTHVGLINAALALARARRGGG